MAKKSKKAKKSSSDRSSSRQMIERINLDPSLKFRVEEAYKGARTNIMFSVMKKGCKTIVISSSAPNEGKTTTTINLAITFAQANQKVLLIDGDLRKPKIHHYFSISNAPGLTNYLGSKYGDSAENKIDINSVIHATEYDNLAVLCSGSIPPNPAEILGSEAMQDFLNALSRSFDYIIIDTPPINVVSDALPIIKTADGVVLVVRSNYTTHPEVQKALSALEFIDAKILGFIVNFVPTHSGKYSYGKYGKYRYGKYKNAYGYGGYSGYYTYGYGGYSTANRNDYGYQTDNKGNYD